MLQITANWELRTSRTIVLALDSSESGREAVTVTASLARRSGSAVLAACVPGQGDQPHRLAAETLSEFTRSGVRAWVWEGFQSGPGS